MAKHTLQQILGIFAANVGHTHEAAVQATYDAGHDAGLAVGASTILDSQRAALREEGREAGRAEGMEIIKIKLLGEDKDLMAELEERHAKESAAA